MLRDFFGHLISWDLLYCITESCCLDDAFEFFNPLTGLSCFWILQSIDCLSCFVIFLLVFVSFCYFLLVILSNINNQLTRILLFDPLDINTIIDWNVLCLYVTSSFSESMVHSIQFRHKRLSDFSVNLLSQI